MCVKGFPKWCADLVESRMEDEAPQYLVAHTPLGDNIRATGTSSKWTRLGMPHDSGGILRGCPILGGAICPYVVWRVVKGCPKWCADARDLVKSRMEDEAPQLLVALMSLGCRLRLGLGFRVEGLGCRVQGLGFRV